MADGFGNYDYVAREIIKGEEVIDFTTYESFADRFARKFGASLGSSLNESLKTAILNQKLIIK